MGNRDLQAGWKYHDSTKHSPESVRSSGHFLDWPNQPLPFKIYSGLESFALDRDIRGSEASAFDAMSATPRVRGRVMTKTDMGEILFLSAGITKRRRYPGGEMLFRAAACTGALYHIDLYVITGELADLEAGVYHFGPHDFRLTRLRAGDCRSGLLEAAGGDPAIAHAPAVIASVSTFWRNSWKYQSRTYRHCFWDNGTILANLHAAAASREIPTRLIMGFVDSWLSGLLALDTQKEAVLSLVALGHDASAVARARLAPPPLTLQTRPLSETEVDYPAIREMHESSALASSAEVAAWRDSVRAAPMSALGSDREKDRVFPLQHSAGKALPEASIEKVVLRRGSTRQFARVPIEFRELSNALHYGTQGVPDDFFALHSRPLNDLYLIVNAVEGIPRGTYWFDRAGSALRLLREGDFRREAGFLGLGQEIPADASVNIYFLADLETVFSQYGNRGYRVAQLEASIVAGNLYLAAYAQGLGASGLTFFDDEVTAFFSPHAAGKSVMFLIALGRSVRSTRAAGTAES